MRTLRPDAHVAAIADAGHDVHLGQPGLWQAALEPFLAAVESGERARPGEWPPA